MSNIETLERSVQEDVDEVRKTGEQLKNKAENALEDFVDLVRRHPAAALSITLAAGFAAGTLATAVSRRRYSPADHIKNLAGTGVDAWERLRNGFEEASCALKDAVEEAAKKFK